MVAEKRLTSDEVLIVSLHIGTLICLDSVFEATLLICVVLGLELEVGHHVHVVREVVLKLTLPT